MAKLIKKGNLYFPSQEFKRNSWLKDKLIYQKAARDPVKFWEELAKDLKWSKKWEKGFESRPPYFKWFKGGKINITENCLDRNLKKLKNKPALIWEPEPIKEKGRVLTYFELFQEVNKFANALKKLGVKKGTRVGIYLPMIPELVISMLSCARIGAVHTVVFSAFSPAALRVRLRDTGAKILITADGYYRRGQIINLKQQADQGTKSFFAEASEGKETKVEKVIVVKRAKNEIPWQNRRDLWWHELLKDESDKCQPEIMDSEDLLFLLATSGSTGRPKQIIHTCGGYTLQAYWTGKWIFDLKKKDILWCTSDLGWITGHSYTCYSPLLNGVTTLIFEGAPDWPTPDRWAQIIEKHKVTIFYTAPTAIRMFEKLDGKISQKYKFKSLRLLGSVGEPIDEAAWLWYFKNIGKEKCPIVDTWWQTETGGILITSLPGIGPFKPAFSGLAFPGIKLDIFDEKGRPCLPEKPGNLVILPPFAPGLLRGIYKNPKKYLQTYWSQYGKEIFFTSDAAFRDKNGLIRIVGRVDDVIKTAGHRFTTGELEAAVNLHPDITECAVVGMPDEIKGEIPVVFVVLRKTRPVEKVKKEVIEQLKKEIGIIALPKEVLVVEDLPKTRSGKIMRRILKKILKREELDDLSTLSNPRAVEKIKKVIQQQNKI